MLFNDGLSAIRSRGWILLQTDLDKAKPNVLGSIVFMLGRIKCTRGNSGNSLVIKTSNWLLSAYQDTVKPENKPQGLYFSKALFEGLIFRGAYIWRGLSTERNLCFKIDWASLIVGSKFTVFALFYFVFEGNFPSTSPQGAYIWRGDFTEGFLHYRFGGLIFGGAYTWRGLF